MNKTFIIDGGAGRVIASIPALEKYVLNHPDENVTILVHGWSEVFLSNKLLQNITFNMNQKGVFDRYLKNSDSIVTPEPYKNIEYINQRCSLVEAFDYEINGSLVSEKYATLYLSQSEKLLGKKIIRDVKNLQKKEKTVVIQPFGSTITYEEIDGMNHIIDPSGRSMNFYTYITIAEKLSKKYNVILFAEKKMHFLFDQYSFKPEGDLRVFMSIINEADYYIGCDSVGQHIARGLDKKGTILYGSTFPINTSYPDWFNIIDRDKDTRVYSPLRLSHVDSEFADRLNDECMMYPEKEVPEIIQTIINNVEKVRK